MIPVPVYTARHFTAVIEGSIWQPVVCEHCGVEWAFRVRLTGIGKGESPYMLDDEGANRRASERARASLEEDRRTLSAGVARDVACPSCGKYQREMVGRLRAAHASGWGALGAASIVVGTMIALRGLTGEAAAAWIASGAITIGLGIASFVRRRHLQRRFDPNAGAVTSAGVPYRAPAESRLGAGPVPEAITRVQYESACAEAAAEGAPPPAPIAWPSARDGAQP